MPKEYFVHLASTIILLFYLIFSRFVGKFIVVPVWNKLKERKSRLSKQVYKRLEDLEKEGTLNIFYTLVGIIVSMFVLSIIRMFL